jgi:outer membrane lipoprotein-sorting protein
MKHEKNIETRLEQLASAIPSDDSFVKGVMSRLETSSDSVQKPKPTFFRRIVMKNKFKFAAAIILIAALIGITHFGVPIDGADVAWAQVVEQLNSHERYKCRQRVARENGPQVPTMTVYHWNLSLRRQEVEDGTIHIIDMRGKDAITVELYPDKKKAVVTKLLGFGPRKDPDIIDMVKRFEQQSTEPLGTRKQDGILLYGFRHKPNEYNDFTVWVDAATKLPVEIELRHPNAGQTIYMDEFEFDFDLDPSAFSTAIPEGYEVKTIITDYRPKEPKEVAAQDIQSGLNHKAYTIKPLPWIKKLTTLEMLDPLGTKAVNFVTGILTNENNIILIVQGNYYDTARMVWLPQQELVLETEQGVKLYNHPNGSIYAQLFLEAFAKAKPDLLGVDNLGEERITRMIVMPKGVVLGLSANKPLSNDALQELADALTEIQE